MQRMLFDLHLSAMQAEGGSFAQLCESLGGTPGPNWPDRFGASMYTWASAAIKTPIRTLSLFSGAGGLDIAFHDAGFQIETAIEIDERFAATLRANTKQGGYQGKRILTPDFTEG